MIGTTANTGYKYKSMYADKPKERIISSSKAEHSLTESTVSRGHTKNCEESRWYTTIAYSRM